MVRAQAAYQPTSYNTISSIDYVNDFSPLDTSTGNQRYFVFQKSSIAKRYEVGGSLNGNLLSTVATANLYETTGGTLYDKTVTTTEPVSGANGVTSGGSWTEKTSIPIANLVNDTINWCLGRSGKIQQINQHSQSYGLPEITRTTDFVWNATYCRPTFQYTELGSPLQVTTEFGYDSFGNVIGEQVTGYGMPTRSTTASYSDVSNTTGQFPLSTTNALNQKTDTAWNYDLGVPSSTTDPNGISTSWLYDAFGRRKREVRADATFTMWEYLECTSCDARIRTYLVVTSKDVADNIYSVTQIFLDQFDRSIYEYERRMDGNYIVTTRDFDSLGRVAKEYFPFATPAVKGDHTSFNYDVLGRPTWISRPTSDSVSAFVSTTFSYEGLKSVITDAQSKRTAKTISANGWLAQSADHNGYYQEFDCDAFGSPKRVRDNAGNTLQSSDYNNRGMLTARTDLDMGSWGFSPNALGEVVSQTDAKGQTTSFEFDLLGRLKKRIEPEGESQWIWGVLGDNTTSSKYVGRLKTVSGPSYSETYVYDSIGRPSSTTIAADTSYQIDYSYNSNGALDTLTYPTSTSSYRLKLQYEYQNGHLYRIRDFNTPNTNFWTANTFGPRGQVTKETLGNGLITSRNYDAVTGLMWSIQTGPFEGSGVQDHRYEWDLVGNLKKRKDLNQSTLTEELFYDNLYRLDYSERNSVQNLDMTYDALGNITSKSDVGTYTYHATKRHQVTSTSNGWSFGYDANGNMTSGRGATIAWTSYNYPSSIANGLDTSAFSYTPDRQYWRQISNYTSGGAATTIYVGGLLEKVTTSAGTDYRHMIRAGGATVIVSRQSSGTNSTYYVTSDHLGSSSAITNSAGGVLVNSSFDAFGKRRGSNWMGNPSVGDWTAIAGTTRRGYTEHSMLDNLNLTHMNGRVYDQVLGKFTSADPFISDAYDTQNYNRYSYVQNNPLSFIDPSGFDKDTLSCPKGAICPPPRLSQSDDFRQTPCDNGFGGSLSAGACLYATSQIGMGWAIAASQEAAHRFGIATIEGSADISRWTNIAVDAVFTRPILDATQNVVNLSTGQGDAKDVADLAVFGVTAIFTPEARVGRGTTTVIGKLSDLKNLAPGEQTLLGRLPNLGSPKANWKQNSGVLRQEMGLGRPIRDATVDSSGGLINNTGFLRAERNLLQCYGWCYNPTSTMWQPPMRR